MFFFEENNWTNYLVTQFCYIDPTRFTLAKIIPCSNYFLNYVCIGITSLRLPLYGRVSGLVSCRQLWWGQGWMHSWYNCHALRKLSHVCLTRLATKTEDDSLYVNSMLKYILDSAQYQLKFKVRHSLDTNLLGYEA